MRNSQARLTKAISVLILLVLVTISTACGDETAPGPTSTSEPTATAKQATTTPEPTFTPEPTATPKPPSTPKPSLTPVPTNTSVSSATPLPPTPASARTTARVVQVIDGDTIEVDIGGRRYRVRYIGMDTPEQGDPLFGEATEANRRLVEGQVVELEKDVSETDRYGRLLRYVYLGDGTFVNAELVEQGYARVSTFPPDVKHQDLFLSLEREARGAELGLWGQVAQVLPTPTRAAPSPTEPATVTGSLRLGRINYDGDVPTVESDEFIEIVNDGPPINLAGWVLRDDNGNVFVFPSVEIATGQACRVYTNEDHPEHCGFNFGYDEAIWGNKGDVVEVVDPAGNVVDRDCWGTGC